MTTTQLRGLPFYGVTGKRCKRRVNKCGEAFALKDEIKVPHLCHFVVSNKRGLRFNTFTKCCGSMFDRQTSEYSLNLSSVEERLASNNGSPVSKGI